MKRFARTILLLIFLLCCFWSDSCPSTGGVQTYVSKDSLIGSTEADRFTLSFAEQMPDSTPGNRANSTRLRDPNYAIFVALVPGAVVHGAGHSYAGKVRTGFILLGCELVGAGLVYLGGVTGIESGEPSPGGKVAMATGGTLFYGSWAYDLVFAPLSIKKENEKLLRGKRTCLELRLKNGDVRLITVFRF